MFQFTNKFTNLLNESNAKSHLTVLGYINNFFTFQTACCSQSPYWNKCGSWKPLYIKMPKRKMGKQTKYYASWFAPQRDDRESKFECSHFLVWRKKRVFNFCSEFPHKNENLFINQTFKSLLIIINGFELIKLPPATISQSSWLASA